MAKLNYELKGVDKLLKDLSKLGKKADIQVNAITKATALDIEADAKTLAPKDTGKLAQSINAFEVGKNSWAIVAFAKYAAYMEFGTGKKVSVPPELRELAIKFKGKGVKEIHLMPQPFMYPSYVVNKQYYIEDLEALLKRLSNE